MADTRAALVTGGASGIGRATVDRLLAAGWRVVVADYNAATGKSALEAWAPKYPGRVDFVRTDVARESEVEAAVRRVSERFGRLDFVFNNAGVGGAFGPITELDADDWDYTFAVLVRGVFLGTKHGARVMQTQATGGAIVNTGSIAGLAGGGGPQAYSAAKAAVIHFTRMAAAENLEVRYLPNFGDALEREARLSDLQQQIPRTISENVRKEAQSECS